MSLSECCSSRTVRLISKIGGREMRFVRSQRMKRNQIVRASSDNGSDDLDRQLMEDMERLRQRQPSSAAPSSFSQQASSAQSSSKDSPMSGVKEAVDKILIADFFFILFALAWLGAGLVAKSAFNTSAVLDTWLSLWQWVFQPAIGVLMLGALVSGGVGWAKDNLGGGK